MSVSVVLTPMSMSFYPFPPYSGPALPLPLLLRVHQPLLLLLLLLELPLATPTTTLDAPSTLTHPLALGPIRVEFCCTPIFLRIRHLQRKKYVKPLIGWVDGCNTHFARLGGKVITFKQPTRKELLRRPAKIFPVPAGATSMIVKYFSTLDIFTIEPEGCCQGLPTMLGKTNDKLQMTNSWIVQMTNSVSALFQTQPFLRHVFWHKVSWQKSLFVVCTFPMISPKSGNQCLRRGHGVRIKLSHVRNSHYAPCHW